jgi:hypothetical protein
MGYSEAQKRAIMRYKLKNRERINEQARLEYQRIKADPNRYSKRLDCVRKCNQRYRESQLAEHFAQLIRTYAQEELKMIL